MVYLLITHAKANQKKPHQPFATCQQSPEMITQLDDFFLILEKDLKL